MDPNATLKRIKDHLWEVRNAQEGDNSPLYPSVAEAGADLADATEDLLEWLAKGGFPPDWTD